MWENQRKAMRMDIRTGKIGEMAPGQQAFAASIGEATHLLLEKKPDPKCPKCGGRGDVGYDAVGRVQPCDCVGEARPAVVSGGEPAEIKKAPRDPFTFIRQTAGAPITLRPAQKAKAAARRRRASKAAKKARRRGRR